MNKKILISLLGLTVLSLAACGKQGPSVSVQMDDFDVDDSDILHSQELLADMSTEDLSSDEEKSLIQMRQEEMLARDVYYELYTIRGKNIFKNISRSEQTHMDTVKFLLDKYGLEDPVNENIRGSYDSEEIQSLYTDLVEQGNKSLLDALIVGATIEDLDIKDLEDFMDKVDNEDILTAYQNLVKGSRNHIRSFSRQIESEGSAYQAQFISEDEYQNILKGNQENFVVDGEGEKL